MNMFEDFIGYQSSTVLDEPEREAGTTSIPIPQREEYRLVVVQWSKQGIQQEIVM